MRWWDKDIWQEVYDTLGRNKLRSLLTAFGIFWGIFMLVVLMGGSKGVKTIVNWNMKDVTQNSCFVGGGRTAEPYDGFQSGRQWSLDLNDIERLTEKVKEVELVSPVNINRRTKIVYGSQYTKVVLRGVLPNYARIEEPSMIYGRFLCEADNKEERKVCVLGDYAAAVLFGRDTDPCGKFINVGGLSYQIVGVQNNKATVRIFGDPREMLTMPLSTYNKVMSRGRKVDFLAILVDKKVQIGEIEDRILGEVKAHHHIAPTDEHAVFYFNLEQMFQIVSRLFLAVNVLIWIIGIGTVAGGVIGVTNIMMVVIRERRQEIGVRRAIGARQRDIVSQILIESVVLSLVAGWSGLCLGMGVLSILNAQVQARGMPMGFQISFHFALIALLALCVLGIVAAVGPCRRAMSIEIIDAIRDE